MYYIGKAHRHRFEQAVKKNPHKCAKEYLAVLYLLSADYDLWLDTMDIRDEKSIKFALHKQPELTAEQYTLYKAAQDIYTGSAYINLQDLGDRYAIQEQIANAILEALRIARKGYSHIGIEKQFN
jgi:hypothetical protein